LKDRRIYIADGHHRYETGLAYLNEEIEAVKIDFDEGNTHFALATSAARHDEMPFSSAAGRASRAPVRG